jgi:hypothetical protein
MRPRCETGRTVLGRAAQRLREGDGRIALRFRIGVTGHRALADPGNVSVDVAAAVQRLVDLGGGAGTTTTPIYIACVSAIAEGADRLVAYEVCRREGARLEVVLPMPAEAYQEDFETQESKDEFAALIKTAAQVVVVGRAENRKAGYERAGRAVVDRSDVMIAVWDGKGSRGRGGTADIVEYARSVRKPLLIIPQDGRHRLIEEFGERAECGSLGPLRPSAFARLDRFNRRAVPPAAASAVSAQMADTGSSELDSKLTRFITYANPFFTRADSQAKMHQAFSLWVSRVLYFLAPLAVVLVSTQIVLFPKLDGLALAEVVTLLAIVGLLRVEHLYRWHENWISYRYLAERIRSSIFLSACGIGEELDHLPTVGLIADPAEEWLSRAFEEIWRLRPIELLSESDVGPVQRLLTHAWIEDQVNYHRAVAVRNRRGQRRWTAMSFVLFGVSIVAAVSHSIGLFGEPAAFASVAIPAVAGAISAYAAHREYAQQGTRSQHMAARLQEAERLMKAASSLDAVQQIAVSTEQIMRGETSDWFALVRLHEPEIPA